MKKLAPGKSLSLGHVQTPIQAGLGWSPNSAWRSREIDLDAGAVKVYGSPFNPDSLRAVSTSIYGCTVFFDQLHLPGLDHSGDDLTGTGSDYVPDEVITTHPQQLGNADGVVYYVNIHEGTKHGVELDEVSNVFWRLDGAGAPIVRDVDREFKGKRSAILGGIFRNGMSWDAHYLSISSEYEIAGLLQRLGVTQF